jgi:tetrahydromethanopterin S-methyltransferase subunit G
MGQQHSKIEKRRRRLTYLKRKKEAVKAELSSKGGKKK